MIQTDKFITAYYLKFRYATQCPTVLIDAVHAAKPNSDKYTGKIVAAVAASTGCNAIIAIGSRDVADINRPPNEKNSRAVNEFRNTINHLLNYSGLLNETGNLVSPVLHLAIHGMAYNLNADIELGTCYGQSCSPQILEQVKLQIEQWAPSLSKTPKLTENKRFSGNISKTYHRTGDSESGYTGYGDYFNTIQIEFARWLRESHRDAIVELLCSIIGKFNQKHEE